MIILLVVLAVIAVALFVYGATTPLPDEEEYDE